VITESVDDAVTQYLDPDYVPTVISEWARKEFHCVIEPQDLRDTELAILESTVRDQSREEAKSSIITSLDEFMDPDADPEDWDYNRLASWAGEEFGVTVSGNQLKKMDRDHIKDSLIEAALEQIERKDTDGIAPFLEKNFAQKQLAEWANNKFDVKIRTEDLIGKTPQQAADFILQQAHESYGRREAEYPIEYALEQSIHGGGIENIYVSEQLSTWLRAKYGTSLTGDEIRALPVPELHRRMVEISSQAGPRMEKEVEDAVTRLTDSKELAAWVSNRLQIPLNPEEFEGEPADQRKARLLEWGHAYLRQELTELERRVLLQIYDSTWKDHLYAMDLLRESIGLRGVAERDPRIEYKKEGSRLFNEFMKTIRDRVTDIIFKVRYEQANVMQSVYHNPVESFQRVNSYGVAGSPAAQEVRAERAALQEASPPPAVENTSEEAPVATIVNEEGKVGRNDPCPCGSGKKYKQCHGKDA
jgi:preprotein translocase subunit SecA